MGIDLKMAWRNIWRNPRRTVLTVLAIAFACVLLVFMLSFQLASYDTMINSSLKIHTGHLQIQAAGYQEKNDVRLAIEQPAPLLSMIQNLPHVKAASARARGFALVSSEHRSYGVMVEGIDPEGESRITTLADIIVEGSYLSSGSQELGQDLSGALIGNILARNLKVKVGEEVTILGQGRDGSIAATVVKIQGIYASGLEAFDRSVIQIPLSEFQPVFTMEGAVHEIVVSAHSIKNAVNIEQNIGLRLRDLGTDPPLVVLDWETLVPGLKQGIQIDLVSGLIFYVILVLVVAFSILNTFLMAILERTHEFGIMMAVGTKPWRLMRLVILESTAMTAVGVLSGMIIGCLITWFFSTHGIDLGSSSEMFKQYGIPSLLYPRLSIASVVSGPLAVMCITLLAAFYPATKIRRLKPVDALRHT